MDFAAIWPPLWLTTWVSGLATLIGLLAGSLLGYVLARKRFLGRDALDAVILLPLVLPPTVLGFYLLVVLGQRSGFGPLCERVLGRPLVFTPAAAVIAACVHTVPMVAKSMRGAFAVMDRSLEDAARLDGASSWSLFFHVHLPQVIPPLVAASTMAFARAVGDFGVTLMVAGNIPGRTQTASIAIYDLMMANRDRDAIVLSLLVSAGCVFVVWLSARAGRLYHGEEA